ncbi:hypothetical protein [Streptomyces albidoflavus]|uniref:hypothetical protein n=1 Tax=Streptomyces albidoflavus TaxID=1886 RepID=UPI00188B4324|nr:hypothetical protein [Streptomyces albidoflavus]MBF4138132.1 hypothetical protein [Streptomyces albidoflavus]
MTIRVRALSIACLAGASVLLAGCGEAADSGDDKGSAPAGGTSTKATPSPEPSTPPPGPEMKLPSNLKVTFEETPLEDADEAAALRDAQLYATSTVFGIAEQDPKSKAPRYYSVPGSQAEEYAQYRIGVYAQEGLTMVGERRHSRAEVRPADGKKDGYTVTFCSDESKVAGKHIGSGETFPSDPGPMNLWHWTLDMVPSPKIDGLWLTKKAIVKGQASAECG